MPSSFSIFNQKLSAAAAQAAYLPRTVALVWNAAPSYTSTWAALLVIQGLLPAAASSPPAGRTGGCGDT